MNEEQFNEMRDKIIEHDLQIKRIVSDSESEKETRKRRNDKIDEELERLKQAIYGNGREGLRSRVKGLEDKIKDSTDQKKWHIDTLIAIAAIIISVIAIILK